MTAAFAVAVSATQARFSSRSSRSRPQTPLRVQQRRRVCVALFGMDSTESVTIGAQLAGEAVLFAAVLWGIGQTSSLNRDDDASAETVGASLAKALSEETFEQRVLELAAREAGMDEGKLRGLAEPLVVKIAESLLKENPDDEELQKLNWALAVDAKIVAQVAAKAGGEQKIGPDMQLPSELVSDTAETIQSQGDLSEKDSTALSPALVGAVLVHLRTLGSASEGEIRQRVTKAITESMATELDDALLKRSSKKQGTEEAEDLSKLRDKLPTVIDDILQEDAQFQSVLTKCWQNPIVAKYFLGHGDLAEGAKQGELSGQLTNSEHISELLQMAEDKTSLSASSATNGQLEQYISQLDGQSSSSTDESAGPVEAGLVSVEKTRMQRLRESLIRTTTFLPLLLVRLVELVAVKTIWQGLMRQKSRTLAYAKDSPPEDKSGSSDQ